MNDRLNKSAGGVAYQYTGAAADHGRGVPDSPSHGRRRIARAVVAPQRVVAEVAVRVVRRGNRVHEAHAAVHDDPLLQPPGTQIIITDDETTFSRPSPGLGDIVPARNGRAHAAPASHTA